MIKPFALCLTLTACNLPAMQATHDCHTIAGPMPMAAHFGWDSITMERDPAYQAWAARKRQCVQDRLAAR